MTREHKDMHHRLPRSQGGTNDKLNLSHVSVTKHRAWHTLFRNLMPKDIALIMNAAWVPRDWRMVAFKTPDKKDVKKRARTRVIYECAEFTLVLKEKSNGKTT